MIQPLYVEIFDTTDNPQKRGLENLLSKNGTEIELSSIHTAASCDSDSEGIRFAYHWVTVVYRRIG